MKNAAILILLAATVTLGALYFRERHQTRKAEMAVSALQTNVTDIQARLAQQETRAASLQTYLKDERQTVAAKAEEVAYLQQAITNRARPEAKDKDPMAEMFKGVGEMFKNPEMKGFIKNQQKTVLSGMLEKTYAPLFAQLGLPAEQTAALKDLLVNKSLVGAGAGMSLMSGDLDSTNRVQIVEQVKKDSDAIDEQIKQMLGDENYKQFQGYEKSLPDRMAVGMFKDQQGGGAGALTPEQEAQLTQVMSEERQNFKFTTDFSDQSKFAGGLANEFTEEKLNQFLQEQEQLHQRYQTRAQTILNAEQSASYEKFLSAQRQMQSLGLKMASKMFSSKPGAN
jgi:hypothetical protein